MLLLCKASDDHLRQTAVVVPEVSIIVVLYQTEKQITQNARGANKLQRNRTADQLQIGLAFKPTDTSDVLTAALIKAGISLIPAKGRLTQGNTCGKRLTSKGLMGHWRHTCNFQLQKNRSNFQT